jgi:hypothetical protein
MAASSPEKVERESVQDRDSVFSADFWVGGWGGEGGGAVLYGQAALLLYSQIGPSNKQSVSIQHDFPSNFNIKSATTVLYSW